MSPPTRKTIRTLALVAILGGATVGCKTSAPPPAGAADAAVPSADAAVTPVISPMNVGVWQGDSASFAVQGAAPSAAVTWSVRETDGGSITPAGQYLAPAKAGTFHVAATVDGVDVEPPAVVTVPEVMVSFTSPTLSVAYGATVTLRAKVTGTVDSRVQYELLESGGGTLVGDVYTAPGTPGTFHVRATSVADATKTALLTLEIQHPTLYEVRYKVTGNRGSIALQLNLVTTSNTIVTGDGEGAFSSKVPRGSQYLVSMSSSSVDDRCLLLNPYGVVDGPTDILVEIRCDVPRTPALAFRPTSLERAPDGTYAAFGPSSVSNFYMATLAHWRADGSSLGAVYVDIYGVNPEPGARIVGDKVLVFGNNGQGASQKNWGRLARYNADGSLDTSFHGTGQLDIDWFGIGGDTLIQKVAIDAEGRILVSGNAYNGAAMVAFVGRLMPDGSFDSTFATGGKYSTNGSFGRDVTALAALPGGGVMFSAADAPGGAGKSHVIQLTSAGLGGQVALFDGYAITVALQGSQPIFVWRAGSTVTGYRFQSDGTVDSTFALHDFTLPLYAGGHHQYVRRLLVRSDGRLLLCGGPMQGNFSATEAVVGFCTAMGKDGSIDEQFGRAGIMTFRVAPEPTLSGGSVLGAYDSPDGVLAIGYNSIVMLLPVAW